MTAMAQKYLKGEGKGDAWIPTELGQDETQAS